MTLTMGLVSTTWVEKIARTGMMNFKLILWTWDFRVWCIECSETKMKGEHAQ
jgi:hypothetical protein